MKNSIIRVFSLLLAVVMITGLLSVSANAVSTETVSQYGITITIDNVIEKVYSGNYVIYKIPESGSRITIDCNNPDETFSICDVVYKDLDHFKNESEDIAYLLVDSLDDGYYVDWDVSKEENEGENMLHATWVSSYDSDKCLYILFMLVDTNTGDSPDSTDSKFQTLKTYTDEQFIDVASDQWFKAYVEKAYKIGIINGRSGNTFDPSGNMTVAEAITMACRVYSTYSADNYDFTAQSGEKWYQPYISYALNHGIVTTSDTFTNTPEAPIIKIQMAHVFANALPNDKYSQINDLGGASIIPGEAQYSEDVYKLYRAGILTGNDKYGTFNALANITRAEAATIITRTALSSTRVSFTLG